MRETEWDFCGCREYAQTHFLSPLSRNYRDNNEGRSISHPVGSISTARPGGGVRGEVVDQFIVL
jgi:hypothetical protein